MSRIAAYIRGNTEAILADWEEFAGSLPGCETLDMVTLRDHAREMLGVIAADLEAPQTPEAQAEKSKGESDAEDGDASTAAHAHGAGRAESGFTLAQMVSEFRALRASVTRLWARDSVTFAAADVEDLTRFNEAIDQAIAESITRFNAEVDQTKDRFLAILGHDLRTPIGAISMSSQFLLDAIELPEPALTLVAGMGRSARRMNQMVLDLIEFTRLRFGDQLPLECDETDVRTMLEEVVAEVAASHPATDVQTSTTGDMRGTWDRARLAQAFTNLVGNAVQHGAKSSVVQVVAVGEGDTVTIKVQNHGPVIPADKVASIFQAMTMGTGGAGRDSRHMGLGLYIVDRIVAAHGGTVGVESTAEQGTTFTVRLPRQAPAA
jgi:signal transduction histidine kinase